jgi:histidinol-phosphate/aromatic aminotransferase/cobyric acid decarboxylase-like protein
MKLDEFIKIREQLRKSQPQLIDCSEMNLYRSLATFDATRFGAIPPSNNPKAAYRCHAAEAYLSFLEWPDEMKKNIHVSHGVRRSLSAIFSMLAKQKKSIAIPDDVYPVYQQLALEAGVETKFWSARNGIPEHEFLTQIDAILICAPLKPWGTRLSSMELNRLDKWANGNENRMLVFDCAYAVPDDSLTKLIREEKAIGLLSLSKQFLIPDHLGLCIAPERFRMDLRNAFLPLPKDELKLRVAFEALEFHSARPQNVAHAVTVFSESAHSKLNINGLNFNGYFSSSEKTFEDHLQNGILGIPASVFGSDKPGTVLSCLPPASARE